MSVQIPHEVAFFLNLAGVPYPDIDADQVRQLARDVGDLGNDMNKTYDDAVRTVKDMESAMSGHSYQAILTVWMHNHGKMAELRSAFDYAGTALDIAADFIEALQIAVLTELAAMAASFISTMFSPAGPAIGPLLVAAARRILEQMAKNLMWYIGAEVVMKALEPLGDRFEQFLKDAVRPPDSTPSGSGPGQKFHYDPDGVEHYNRQLDKYVDDMRSHGRKFGEKLANYDFATPGSSVPDAELPDVSAPPSADNRLPDSPPSTYPNSYPNSQPGPQPPSAGAPTGNAPENSSSTPGGERATGGVDSTGGASPGVDSTQSGSAPPGGAVPPTVSGSAPPPAGDVSGGVDSAGPSSPASDGSSGTDAEAAENDANVAENAGDSPDRAEPVSGAAGEAGPAVLPGATPGVSGAQSPASQSPAAAAANAQRSGESSTGKAATAQQRGSESEARRRAAPTPWSRAGKAARVAATTKRSDKKAPAVSTGDVDSRDGAAETSSSTSDGHPDAGSQVFAPDTAGPPPESVRDKETGSNDDRDSPAGPAQTDADSSTGARR